MFSLSILSPVVEPVYIVTILLFIVALRRMSNPKTARSGIIAAGAAMLVAAVVTIWLPGMGNLALIGIAALVGGSLAWVAARRVQMTGMPQMVAIYNGLGGGAAAAVAAVALVMASDPLAYLVLAVIGAAIGSVTFAGSLIAFLKLQGWMRQRPIVFPAQQPVNMAVLALCALFGVLTLSGVHGPSLIGWMTPFFLLALLFGAMMALPIGGADMPVVIALLNALTGVAVAFDGLALTNYAMVIAGTLVGASGSLLTLLMARAMNRSLGNVLFGAFGATEEASGSVQGSMKPIEASDVAVMLAYASKVIVAPGYGMAVAQAQHKVKELMDILESKGVTVKFAIHPVAGRMPGHMNVLLAEAGVPYDRLFDRDEINEEFASTDVVLVIGANDTVNPAARRAGSPLQGMPILDVDRARNVVVIKRGQGKGFAGVENELFYKDNTRMLYGDAQEAVAKLIQELKKL